MKNTLFNDEVEKYEAHDWVADAICIGILTIMALAVVVVIVEMVI